MGGRSVYWAEKEGSRPRSGIRCRESAPKRWEARSALVKVAEEGGAGAMVMSDVRAQGVARSTYLPCSREVPSVGSPSATGCGACPRSPHSGQEPEKVFSCFEGWPRQHKIRRKEDHRGRTKKGAPGQVCRDKDKAQHTGE